MNNELFEKRLASAQHEVDEKRNETRCGAMRQRYHFMPETGWMNDPNGLIFFGGKYHFFFQSNPYSGFWDSMHWGHAVSEDLLHWEYLPFALAPSEPYDDHTKGGCFSGSAIEHEGKLYVFYTSSTNSGDGMIQQQSMAYSEDGIHFEKYNGNPIIQAPEGVLPGEFRDPKVWKQGDFFYIAVAASYGSNGAVLLYESKDLFNWAYKNVLYESRGEWGRMFECPDFFKIGDVWCLTFSPVGSGDHTAVMLIGDFDEQLGRFYPRSGGEMDWGLDYYAPQSFAAPDGRRITVAWANEWEWMPQFQDWGPTYKEGWCGFFNLPREIRIGEDGTPEYHPIRELYELRTDPVERDEITVAASVNENGTDDADGVELRAGDGVSFEMKFELDLEQTDADEVILELRSDGTQKLICRFDLAKGELSVDRNHSDGWSKGISRSLIELCGKKTYDVDIYSDQSSVEIFTDSYRNNHSDNCFAGSEQNCLRIRVLGGRAVIRNYCSYGMKNCWK